MVGLYSLARPFIFLLEPEKAHGLSLCAMKSGMIPRFSAVQDAALEQEVFGLRFPNPVGLAAGFDKNAEAIDGAFGMGFGFVEAGTVTPKPQDGNPTPRIFREPKAQAVINRMGFPNAGMAVFKENLSKAKRDGIVGINIGMNKEQSEPAKDYVALIKELEECADYMTVNISSPNTPGLRNLQSRGPLMELIAALKDARMGDTPILVKLAPDLSEAQQEELAGAAMEAEIDGLILGNTTLDRPEYLPKSFRDEKGGLSGQPLTDKSTQVIHNFYALTKGEIPIIGVGGVGDADQAYAKIKAGASLVQLYSALVFKGPSAVGCINKGLLSLLHADGFKNIRDAVGTAHHG